jgi:hypothetical protein
MMKTIGKIPEGNPFKIPENYFEELNTRIISSTVGNRDEIKKHGLYLKLRPYIAFAASVALLALLSYTGMKLFSPGNQALSLSAISVEEYTEMILNDIDLITLEENSVIPEESTDEAQDRKNEIIDYLLQENIDINEIQDQL